MSRTIEVRIVPDGTAFERGIEGARRRLAASVSGRVAGAGIGLGLGLASPPNRASHAASQTATALSVAGTYKTPANAGNRSLPHRCSPAGPLRSRGRRIQPGGHRASIDRKEGERMGLSPEALEREADRLLAEAGYSPAEPHKRPETPSEPWEAVSGPLRLASEAVLSDRQLEAVRLRYAGHGPAETARRMGVSKPRAHELFETAAKRIRGVLDIAETPPNDSHSMPGGNL